MPSTDSREAILADVRRILSRDANSPIASRPSVLPPRVPGTDDEEIEKLLQEVAALTGHGARFARSQVNAALGELARNEAVRKVVLWKTEGLERLGIADHLRALDVAIIPHDADKHVLAEADLGITEADFVLPETGTLGLLSSSLKPRSVSLLPRVHLALIHRRALRADLHRVFAEAKAHPYLVLITGPSRTSDIELVVTVGVHGPQVLYVWVVDD